MRPALRRNLFRWLERHRMRFLFSFACLGGGRCVARFTMENASNRPMHHGPFYKTAPRRTFIKCTGLFTLRCTGLFTAVYSPMHEDVYGRFHRLFSMHEVVYHCASQFTPLCRKSIARGRLHQFTKTNARGRLRLFRGFHGRSQ